MHVEQLKFILWVVDMQRALRFWRDTVGLRSGMESPHWSELRHGDAIVALHGGGAEGVRDTGLGVQVRDIASACREIAAAGGVVRSGPVRRPGEPILLAECTDPEGNGFKVSQFVG